MVSMNITSNVSRPTMPEILKGKLDVQKKDAAQLSLDGV